MTVLIQTAKTAQVPGDPEFLLEPVAQGWHAMFTEPPNRFSPTEDADSEGVAKPFRAQDGVLAPTVQVMVVGLPGVQFIPGKASQTDPLR